MSSRARLDRLFPNFLQPPHGSAQLQPSQLDQQGCFDEGPAPLVKNLLTGELIGLRPGLGWIAIGHDGHGAAAEPAPSSRIGSEVPGESAVRP